MGAVEALVRQNLFCRRIPSFHIYIEDSGKWRSRSDYLDGLPDLGIRFSNMHEAQDTILYSIQSPRIQ